MDKKSLRFANEKWTEIIRTRKNTMRLVGREVMNLVDVLSDGKALVIEDVMAIWYSCLTENITVDSGLGDEFISRRSKADLMFTGENKNRNRVYHGSVNILSVFGSCFEMYMVYLYG